MAKRRRPYRPPALDGPNSFTTATDATGSSTTTTTSQRGILSTQRETLRTQDEDTVLSALQGPDDSAQLVARRDWLRNFLQKRNLKTDEDFAIDYKAAFPNCIWQDEILQYRDEAIEPMTQAHAALTLIRMINFVLANFTPDQIRAIRLFASADRMMTLSSYNKEVTAGKKTIEAARLAAEMKAPARTTRKAAWSTLARAIAAELVKRHPDWSQATVATSVSKVLHREHGIHRQPDTVARVIRR